MSKEQEATQDDRHFVDCQCPAHKAELLATKEATQDGIERARELPQVSWEYLGEELALFWASPYGAGKEKIATFWWPVHPVENTKEVEALFEAIASRAAFAASEVSRVEAALAELKRERDNWRTACTLASSEKYKAESEVKKFVEVANQNAHDRNTAVDQWESAEQQLAAERKRSGELENALRAARALLASQIEAAGSHDREVANAAAKQALLDAANQTHEDDYEIKRWLRACAESYGRER